MVHDRLASGETTHLLCREIARTLHLKEATVFSSVGEAVGRIVQGLNLNPGDRVVLSPLAPAYWFALLPRFGLIPLLADVLEDSPILDPEAVRNCLPEGPKAIIVDTCLGYLSNVAALVGLGLPVVEDISQGLGGRFEGQPVGTRGTAVLSRFSPETLVAGAGGCLAGFRSTPPVESATEDWESVSDLGAALILSQWRDAEVFAEKKRENFRHLFHRLPKGYRQPKQVGDGEPVVPWFSVLVESGAKEVMAYTRKKAVESDWAFRHQSHLSAESGADSYPRSRYFLFHTLVFPLYSTFSLKELDLLGKVISSLP
jgi:dTDP-4-amino-4,6-dideoxygalactose transaminase